MQVGIIGAVSCWLTNCQKYEFNAMFMLTICAPTHLGRLAHHSACQALHQSLTARQLQQFSVEGLADAGYMVQLCKKK
jgi:hypothetical protein